MPPSHDPTDDELPLLIERWRGGDTVAGSELFARVREPLLHRIRWMMGREAREVAESDDFLHATFAAALPALPRFEERGADSFLRWLTAIARNQIRQELRRPREAALSALSSWLVEGAQPDRAQAETLSVDAALALYEGFARLAADEQRLVELRDLEGRSFVEIAALLGCGERQAQRLHARALLRLGRHLRGAE
ncbi:MAG: sigma-70 family RNA polymerase sigma factor [Planctomycetota bacterium]